MLNSWSPADVLYKALKSNSAWATINKINRLAAALRCSSLCRITTPCRDLASKDGIDSENKPTLQHESPTRAEKMQDWQAWVRGQRIAMTVLILKINQLFSTKAQRVPKKCKIGKPGYVVSALLWQFDTIQNDLSGYSVYTKTMASEEHYRPIVSVSSSKVSTFSIVFVSSSKVFGYRSSSCKQEAYPERFLSG